MNKKEFFSKLNKTWKHAGFMEEVTEENLSKCLKMLLETYPVLFRNELPIIYEKTYVIVDIDRIGVL